MYNRISTILKLYSFQEPDCDRRKRRSTDQTNTTLDNVSILFNVILPSEVDQLSKFVFKSRKSHDEFGSNCAHLY
jgi:hypothetical protein